MGVPKFYRWISERYPCLSEVVREYQIPEFDNLYLDMNGIIHNCSHPNDEDVHFRISEEKIFQDIFRYLEFLFRMIKPRKLFFMAIDGVAPRAKMNQQRGRRFRSAKEAETREQEALQKGEVLPDEKRFDSNCITPGTEFMDRLHQHLKYFVAHKLSTDDLWRDVEVILSGHETPGEGEHKIMDYIRYKKSQPDYDPNTRHCLHGLDADLMMLGLCSHEPHFSLLREEVKYIRSKNEKNKRDSNPEAITFHLLHLSLFREYIDHEFEELKTKLPFGYNLENIIDDWVLMGFLVGNDFIPHIPHFHINKSSLIKLYEAYKKVMPQMDGYLNEDGKLNLSRFQKYLNEIANIDIDNFNDTYADLKYFETKTGRKLNKRNLEDTSAFFESSGAVGGVVELSDPENEIDIDYEEEEDSNSSDENDTFMAEFTSHKRDYYMTKLNYADVDESVLKEQAYEYIRAIQWNLHYYYDGCVSWGWYYPHHYAPYISDVKDFSEIDLTFDLGQPFKPFEQLLAVLPSASKDMLPKCFESLVSNPTSQLIDYYPPDFETDQNEKLQAWEAVVLIPFIDEKRLLNAVHSLENKLTNDELRRNRHGPHLHFKYSETPQQIYRSPNSALFPDIVQNHAECSLLDKNAFWLPKERIHKSLCKGVRLDVFIRGFPTLRHIPHKAVLRKEKVRVFESASNGDNMILIIEERPFELSDIIDSYLNETVHVNWPHLLESKVFQISDGQHKYFLENNQIVCKEIDDEEYNQTSARVRAIIKRYKERWGVVTGNADIILHVYPLTGRKYVLGADGKPHLEKEYSTQAMYCPIQTTVKDIPFFERKDQQFLSYEQMFKKGVKCFPIENPYYGSSAVVIDYLSSKRLVKVEVFPRLEPDLREIQERATEIIREKYMPNNILAQRLGISPHLCSRMLGTIFIRLSDNNNDNRNRINIGLNLKFNARNEEVPGFSIKRDDRWLFSDKVTDLFNEYMDKFPNVFERLSTCVEKDCFSIDDIFSGDNKHKELDKLVNWLKSQESCQMKRQKCNAEILDQFVVEAIEDVINTHIVFPKELPAVVETYKPTQLYRPAHHLGYSLPDPKATYELFDRVVNVRSGISVPLGAKGTIIGKHIDPEKEVNTLFDVLFDEDFVGGTKLRSISNKGYKLSPANLINITYGLKISGKYEQFVNCGQPIQSRPQQNFHQNRQNNYSRDQQNYGNFQFSYGHRMPRPRFPSMPAFSPSTSQTVAQSPQTAISIQTLNHSHTSPFQSPKHENRAEEFPQMQQMWNLLTEMNANSNGSQLRTSFANIVSQKPQQNNQKPVNQREAQRESNDKLKNKNKTQKNNIPDIKKNENVGQPSGSNNKSNKPQIKVPLVESFRQILSRSCDQYYKQSPSFDIIKMGPMATKSMKLTLPDGNYWVTLLNLHSSPDEASEFLSHKGLQEINNKFNANIDLSRPERLLSSPSFIVPNQSSPNRPRIPESVLPRPPPNWMSSNKKQQHRHNTRQEIPESFVEYNEKIFNELQKQMQSSRVNTSANLNKERNIQPKKLFDPKSDNLVHLNQRQPQNRNRKNSNETNYDNSSQRKPHNSRHGSANQSAFDNQFVPLQVARNNQSHRTPQSTSQAKGSAQKQKDTKNLIEINSTSSEEPEILSSEVLVPESNASKNDDIEILTPDSLKASSSGHSSGKRRTSKKLVVNLD